MSIGDTEQSTDDIRTSFARGDVDLARAKLAAFVDSQASDPANMDGTVFLEACVLSVALQTWETLSYLAERRFSLPTRAVFVSEERNAGLQSVVRWTSLRDDQNEFAFDASLKLNERTSFFVGRFIATLQIISVFMKGARNNHGTIFINLDDVGMVPGLAFCEYRDDYFLLPDVNFILGRGYRYLRKYFLANVLPWTNRKPVAFWRGSSTGLRTDGTWQSLQRIKLCQVAQKSPELFDVGISAIVQIRNEDEVQEIRESGVMRPPVPEVDMFSYKVQIDVDGNSNSWPGLFSKLISGSPILKIKSPKGYRQWYYNLLQPWKNYVPVSVEMDDLEDKARWLLTNEDAAEDIGRNARALSEVLDYESELARACSTIAECFRHSSYSSHARTSGSGRARNDSAAKLSSDIGAVSASSTVGTKFHEVMYRLYGRNIWDGFVPRVELPQQVQGWNGDHPALRRLAASGDRRVVIDVGVWKGQSTIAMAASIRLAKLDNCVIAVDTFLGSAEHWEVSELFDRTFGQPNLYESFLGNVYAAGLAEYVIPVPQTPATAARILKRLHVTASIIHIDASHEYGAVMRDIEDYWDLLEPNGILIGDDFHVTWPGVIKAVEEFSARLHLPFSIESPKWFIQKPSLR